MERVRPLMVAAAAVFALAGTGCVTVDPTTKSVKLSVAPTDIAPPTPATKMEFLWQRQLMPLSDAVNDGRKVHGLPGQMFLFASDGSPAEIAGDVTIAAYDETRRPNGVAPHRPEVWHFTKDVLQRLVTSDERFGRTYAMFLPWPDHWKDVTTIRLAARYDGADKKTKLTSQETRLLLDTRPQDSPLWAQIGSRSGMIQLPTAGTGYDAFGAPDPAKLMQQAGRGPAAAYPPTVQPAQPAGYPPGMQPLQPAMYPQQPLPPPTIAPPPGPMQAPTQPLAAPYQPQMNGPAPPPGMPQPIPIPPRTY
jgi:hypothetical protein